jgi:uncharacterized protein YkwD
VQEKTLMNTTPNRWTTALAALAAACALAACGGGGSDSSAVAPTTPAPTVDAPAPGIAAPALVGNIVIDGRNWLNYRRSQIGIPTLAQNTLIDKAAQAHSDYQKLQPKKSSGQPADPSHTEEAGKPGFTGGDLLARLEAAGYSFARNSYAYGEVISATSSNSGSYMADELITAIYHRFVIFEPMFKEIGAGSATTSSGYTYFTADFTANNGYGTGIGSGNLVTWPFSGQTGVTANFFSDYEAPDPVPEKNEVGYPVSVHADITATLTVKTFTIRQRGGADLAARQILHYSDLKETVPIAAAIVPLDPLRAATTYDVAFTGVLDGIPVSKTWSFTTK